MCYTETMKRGFTLIELLVVIAIIGILSSIAIINLNSIRERARTSAASQMLRQVLNIAVLCQDAGGELQCFSAGSGTLVPCGSFGGTIREGDPICTNNANLGNWPAIGQQNWAYRPVSARSDSAAHTFQYIGRDQNNLSTVFTCTEAGCHF